MALLAEHPGPDGTAEPAGWQDSPAPPAAPVPAPALPGAQLPRVSSSPYPPKRPHSIRGPLATNVAPLSGVPSLTGQLCLNRGMRISPSFAQSSCLPPPQAIKILLPCLPPSPSRRLPLLSLELPCSCRAGQTIGCFREIHFWANLPCISVSLTL